MKTFRLYGLHFNKEGELEITFQDTSGTEKFKFLFDPRGTPISTLKIMRNLLLRYYYEGFEVKQVQPKTQDWDELMKWLKENGYVSQ